MLDFILPLFGFAVVGSITPGPNNFMLASSGLNFGFRRTVPHLLGVALGFPLMVLLVGLGLAELFTASPLLHLVLKWLGVLYLAYLAFRIATAPPVAAEGKAMAKPLRFLEAVAFQWINPKAWILAVGAIATYSTMNGRDFGEIAVMAAIFLVAGMPSAILWAGFGTLVRRWLSEPGHVRAFNLTMAAALLASIVPILLE